MMIKRLVGLPGETVAIRSGQVLINGEVLDEPYDVVQGGRDYAPVELGENAYFILGDNRPESSDSRSFGPVSGESIRRRVVQ